MNSPRRAKRAGGGTDPESDHGVVPRFQPTAPMGRHFVARPMGDASPRRASRDGGYSRWGAVGAQNTPSCRSRNDQRQFTQFLETVSHTLAPVGLT